MKSKSYKFPSRADLDQLIASLGEPFHAIDIIGEVDGAEGFYANVMWNDDEPMDWASFRIPNADAPRWWAGVPREDPVYVSAIPDVSPRQLREAMLDIGVLDAVEAIVAASDRQTQIEWEYAVSFSRAHPKWDQMAPALNKTSGDIDNLFRLAATKG